MWPHSGEPQAAFDCNIEDVLDVDQRPYDPKRPQLCLDELNKQLLADVREGLPPAPDKPERIDHPSLPARRDGQRRHGQPAPAGRCLTMTTQRRTKVDWAQLIKDLMDVHYPKAEQLEPCAAR